MPAGIVSVLLVIYRLLFFMGIGYHEGQPFLALLNFAKIYNFDIMNKWTVEVLNETVE